jgi:hypothetical protein
MLDSPTRPGEGSAHTSTSGTAADTHRATALVCPVPSSKHPAPQQRRILLVHMNCFAVNARESVALARMTARSICRRTICRRRRRPLSPAGCSGRPRSAARTFRPSPSTNAARSFGAAASVRAATLSYPGNLGPALGAAPRNGSAGPRVPAWVLSLEVLQEVSGEDEERLLFLP